MRDGNRGIEVLQENFHKLSSFKNKTIKLGFYRDYLTIGSVHRSIVILSTQLLIDVFWGEGNAKGDTGKASECHKDYNCTGYN